MSRLEVPISPAVILLLALAGCTLPSKYVLPGIPAQTARIRVSSVVAKNQLGRNNKILLDIYDYAEGCPDACVRLRSRGYRGTVTMLDEEAEVAVPLPSTAKGGPYERFVPTAANDAVVVPAGKRLMLRGKFTSQGVFGGTCDLPLSFVPEEGRDYVYAFSAPQGFPTACNVRLKAWSTDGERRLIPVGSVRASISDSWVACDSPEICAWNRQPAPGDRPSSPLPQELPRLIHSVPPALPPQAANAGVRGNARVKCVMTAEGTLDACRITKGLPFMDQAVLDAVRLWRFTPPLHDGKPISFELTVVVPVGPKADDERVAGRARLADDEIFDLR